MVGQLQQALRSTRTRSTTIANWGIMWELSYGGAKIHHNTADGNGLGDGAPNWFNGVSFSSPAQMEAPEESKIYENTIDGAAYPSDSSTTAATPFAHRASTSTTTT